MPPMKKRCLALILHSLVAIIHADDSPRNGQNANFEKSEVTTLSKFQSVVDNINDRHSNDKLATLEQIKLFLDNSPIAIRSSKEPPTKSKDAIACLLPGNDKYLYYFLENDPVPFYCDPTFTSKTLALRANGEFGRLIQECHRYARIPEHRDDPSRSAGVDEYNIATSTLTFITSRYLWKSVLPRVKSQSTSKPLLNFFGDLTFNESPSVTLAKLARPDSNCIINLVCPGSEKLSLQNTIVVNSMTKLFGEYFNLSLIFVPTITSFERVNIEDYKLAVAVFTRSSDQEAQKSLQNFFNLAAKSGSSQFRTDAAAILKTFGFNQASESLTQTNLESMEQLIAAGAQYFEKQKGIEQSIEMVTKQFMQIAFEKYAPYKKESDTERLFCVPFSTEVYEKGKDIFVNFMKSAHYSDEGSFKSKDGQSSIKIDKFEGSMIICYDELWLQHTTLSMAQKAISSLQQLKSKYKSLEETNAPNRSLFK